MTQERQQRRGRRSAVIGATVLATLPLWMLVAMIGGKHGFVAYLSVSDRYYRGAAHFLGTSLYPRHEFGTIPRNALAVVLATLLYAVLGGLLGFAIGFTIRRGPRPDGRGAHVREE